MISINGLFCAIKKGFDFSNPFKFFVNKSYFVNGR